MDADDIIASILMREACGLPVGGPLFDRPTLDNIVGRDDPLNPPRISEAAQERLAAKVAVEDEGEKKEGV